MSKKEYLNSLKIELKKRDVKNISDIIEDYEDLIYQKMKDGKSEEEVINDLGNAEDLATAYGSSKEIKGKRDVIKFILLQLFNLLIGLALIITTIAIMITFLLIIISSIVVSVILLFKLFTGVFGSFATVMTAMSLIVAMLFVIAIMIILIKISFLLLYNYFIFNINTLKINKLLYKRIKVKKLILIICCVSFVSMIIFGSLGLASSDKRGLLNFVNVLNEASFGESYEIHEMKTVGEFGEEVKNIDVQGEQVEIIRGDTNKIESNFDVDYEIDNGNLIIKEKPYYGFNIIMDDINPKIIITTKNDIEKLKVDSYSADIENINANSTVLNTVTSNINDKNIFDKTDVSYSINTIDIKVDIQDIDIDKLDVSAIDTRLNLTQVELEDANFEVSYLDVIISESMINKFDVESCEEVKISMRNSKIEMFYGSEFINAIKMDENSSLRTDSK